MNARFVPIAAAVGGIVLLGYFATAHHLPFFGSGASQPPAPRHSVETPAPAEAQTPAPAKAQTKAQPIPPPTTLPRTVLSDDFSDPQSGWALKGHGATWSYDSGTLRVSATRPGHYWNLASLPNTDVTVDVDVTAQNGEGFGVVCRATRGSKHFYSLLVESWDEFAVKDNADTPLMTATSPPSSMSYSELDRLAKTRVTKHLHAECIGNAQRLYVDGKGRVAAADPWKQSGNEVGLMVVAKKDTDNDFVFSNLVIKADATGDSVSTPSSDSPRRSTPRR